MTLLDFIFPKQCVSCGNIGRYICKKCQKQIIPIASNECICPVCEKPAIAGATHPRCRTAYALDGLTSFFYYKDVVRKLITSIKYSFVRDMATELISYIPIEGYEIYAISGNVSTLLLPIPLHAARFRFRGFNQSDIMGKLIATDLNINYSAEILIRQKATPAQVSMKQKQDRLSNISSAFSVQKKLLDPAIKNYLIFDDVFTTGATLREAANVLKRSGATRVWGITIAR